ncbi:hypothetical protein GIB67_003276 [Kingdonia uniflora]|uniref:Phosphoglycerate mutase-like protein 1 n=1 Tax=Kingdonia uniflora TaxID=39325 RepID=A0A7J7LXW9_9MAGN|nr:hypothetical protein GIB67_003276 [Kingdonia uniflora]
MQTAVGVFGGDGYKNGVNAIPLMVENTGKSSRSSISSLNSPLFVAVELCRELLGVHPCDKRRSITEYQPLFPAIDFSLIENDEDILWMADIRETNEEVAARGMKFINWLWTRKEKEIAIVTHSGFLFHTLQGFGKDLHPTMKEETCKHFANCELRSVVIVNRSLMGSNTSTTNYPGKNPSGLDLPSDVMQPEEYFGKEESPEEKKSEEIRAATLGWGIIVLERGAAEMEQPLLAVLGWLHCGANACPCSSLALLTDWLIQGDALHAGDYNFLKE